MSSYLNVGACNLIGQACRDLESTFARLADDEKSPDRLRSQFSQKRHLARTLAELFETHPAFLAEGADPDDYRAFIWEVER